MYLRSYVDVATTAALSWSQFFLGYGGHHGHPGHEIDYYARNLKTISTIYNLTVYPNNLPIILNGSSAVPPELFSANATGRVSPLGNFTTFEDSIEYFFALALVPAPPAYSVFSSAEVVEFSSGCPEVAASVAYLETRVWTGNASEPGPYLSTLKQVAFWRFDKNGAVQDYDAWIPNLNDWNYLAEGKLDITNPAIQAAEIQQLCPAIQQRCVGKNQQYPDIPTCINTLSAKPFGNFDEVWGNNVVCRSVHVILALVNPDTHCPHVGPTGGGKCVDEGYNEGYFDDVELFGRPRGKVFVCDEKGGRGEKGGWGGY
ncbi:hypothetical protein EG329_007911 [Mollisiaceae sp. DMI_Dod_QoI]|nr:hypothetical protein EG329_007911 [Helotiales sp. DMI_Dod_QoI]